MAQELLDGLPVQLSKEEIQQMKENSQIIVDFDYAKKHKTEENLGILYCYPNFAQTLIMEAQSKIQNTQSKINNYCDAVYSNLKENSLISSENNFSNSQEFYIDYMDKKKEKLAMAIYKNNILTKIKNAWNRFKAKFAKI